MNSNSNSEETEVDIEEIFKEIKRKDNDVDDNKEDDNSESHRVFKIINCKSIKELNVSNFWFPFFDHAELISKLYYK